MGGWPILQITNTTTTRLTPDHRTTNRILGGLLLGLLLAGFAIFVLEGVSVLVSLFEIYLIIAAIVGTVAIQLIVWPDRFITKKQELSDEAQRVVKIGKTEVHLGMVCRAKELPSPQDWLEYAKDSVYFCGGSFPYLTQAYNEAITRFAGKKRMRFLLNDPLSPIGSGRMNTKEPVKRVQADPLVAISNLNLIRVMAQDRGEKAEFEVKVHDQLPFDMDLIDVDSDDAPDAFIQIGHYTLGSIPPDRPTLVVSKKQNREVYDILLRHYRTIHDSPNTYDSDPLKSPYRMS